MQTAARANRPPAQSPHDSKPGSIPRKGGIHVNRPSAPRRIKVSVPTVISAVLVIVALTCGCATNGNLSGNDAAESFQGNSATGADLPTVTIGEEYTEKNNGKVTGVTLSCDGQYPIVYTTDGSDPIPSSSRYRAPLRLVHVKPFLSTPRIARTTMLDCYSMQSEGFPLAVILKAAVLMPDGTIGPIKARTFFPGIDLASLFPGTAVVSIITAPENLLDYETGIMCRGRIYDEWVETEESVSILQNCEYWHVKANYMESGSAWERPASIEIFEDGEEKPSASENCGIRIHGTASRQYAQKGFNVYFREAYGKKRLDYRVIPEATDQTGFAEISTYKSFSLDNGGNGTELLKYRDPLLHTLAAMTGLRVSTYASRPAVLFLNGEYWGVYLLQEKYSGQFFADHYGVEKGNLIVFKEGKLDEGTEEDVAYYGEYLRFAGRNMTDPQVWEAFEQCVDISSMVDYYAYEIFIGNADWFENKNTSMWRVRVPENTNEWDDGRWRFNLYDLEFSAGIYSHELTKPDHDSFAVAKDMHTVFCAALRNDTFRKMLTERLTWLCTALSYDVVSAQIDRYDEEYLPLAALNASRFNLKYKVESSEYGEMTKDEYNLRRFFENRGDFILNRIIPEIEAAGQD